MDSPSNSPFPMGVCQGNTCAPLGQGELTWRGFQSLSRCPKWELGGVWDTWSARTREKGGFGEGICICGGSPRSLPTQSTRELQFQECHHGEELLAGAGLEVEAGEGHEDPAELGDGQALRVIQAILQEKRELGAVQNRGRRETLDTSARDSSQVGKGE